MNTPNDYPSWKIAVAIGASLVLVGYLDYFTGYEINVSLFYLIPIFFADGFVRVQLWSASLF